jgi:cytochrome c-type biogenesis protein CcmH/NrfG
MAKTTPTEAAAPRSFARALGVGVAVALLTFGVYLQVRGFRFVEYDTGEYLTRNGWVQRGLAGESLAWAWTSFHAANWHPLTWWSHMLDVELFGLAPDAHGSHLLHNAVLHAANTLLVHLLFWRWTGALGRSALVAALFGLHPMHAESVAWVVERKDVLSTLFGLFFLHAWTAWTRKPSVARYALAWVLLALGLSAKSMVITLPCVLVLLDLWPLGRAHLPLSRRIVEKLPFVPLMVASAVLTSAAQSSWGAVSKLSHIGVGPRIANALWAWPNYVWKLVVPMDLFAYYPWRDRTDELGIVAAWSFAFCMLCALAVLLRRRAPYVFSGWFWFVGTLVPVIGLVQVGDQAMADRYSYLPSIGLFAALVWGVAELLVRARVGAPPRIALGVLLVALTAWLGWKQIGYWRDTWTMATRGLEIDPDNGKMHGMRGFDLSERAAAAHDPAEAKRLNELAAEEFKKALAFNPSSVIDLDRLAYQYMRLGRNAEAEPLLLRALAIQPGHSQVLNHLGGMCTALGRWPEAEQWMKQALAADPNNHMAANNLGYVLEQQGKLAEAEQMARRALAILPNYARAELRLAVQCRKQKRIDEAWQHLERALLLGLGGIDRPEAENERKLLIAAGAKGAR